MIKNQKNLISVLSKLIDRIIKDPMFKVWTTKTNEEKQALLPHDLSALSEIDENIMILRWSLEGILRTIQEDEAVELFQELRNNGYLIFDEAKISPGVTSTYFIGLRGDFGWLHLYNGH